MNKGTKKGSSRGRKEKGKPVRRQVKKKKKVIDKQAKAYKDLMEKSGNNPQELLDATQKEVDTIKAKLEALSL